ncbi:aspartate/glutamate racemase family protein [Halocatena halophila]|uniref:aspartate/glutamate racemase family protein n=1 Tax=Halocatena halophila TaxID=2814576 RepID=UPI002ED67D8B
MSDTDDIQTVGVLGGMSSESTVTYYRQINAGINNELGGHGAGEVLIRSVNFATIERFIRTEQFDRAGEYLGEAAQALERGGAAFIVMATNTMHRVASAIDSAISIPFVHIVDVAADAICAADIGTVGILGTTTTMEQPFYRDRFAEHGIDVVVPEPSERAEINRIIFEELTKGVVSEASRERYLDAVDAMEAMGAEGVVLGCTEIEMLIEQADRPAMPLFDTTALHVERAVEMSLDGQ